MNEHRPVIIGIAVAALAFVMSSQADVSRHQPLPSDATVLAENAETDQAQENDNESAKMGKEEGTHTGENQGETSDSDTKKVDQPDRQDSTNGGGSNTNNSSQQ